MSSFAMRFVGQEALPSRLSEFDREQFFELGSADVEAITQQFRVSHRLPAALMVLFMRVTGRPLDGFNVLPRNLLRRTAELLGISSPSIATLRSIYGRSQTLFKHQLWAKRHLGLRDLEQADEIQLADALRMHAREATHPDELVRSACQWLYARRIVIPGPRRLKDWARDALAAIEASVLAHVWAAVPVARARELSALAYCIRPETDSTHLEWLKTPPRRHGPASLAETLEKVRFLKALGADTWDLSGVTLAKQQAYARQVQSRRPAKTREINPSRQMIELVCFLRITLLELTDVGLLQSSRRSQQLFREATDRAQASRARATTGLLRQAARANAVLHDEAMTWQDRVLQARQLLAEFGGVTTGSFVSQVRKALAQDAQRVHACLTSLKDLAFGGRRGDRGFEQWKAWTALQGRSAAEIPEGVQLPEVGVAWYGLVHDLDPRSSLRALEACTMMSLRKSLRRGSVWIDHSLSYRERDQMLIPPAHWESQREQHVELLGMPKSPREFLEPLLANLVAGTAAVCDALDRGKIEISADGMLRLPAITALPEKSEPVRTRETVYKLIGNVQFPDLLMQLDAATNFSDALLGHRAQTADELVGLYGALLAHGTDIDAKGVASMIPGLEPSQISVAMRALEGSGRLRRANERVAQFQSQIPIAALWGDGDKASADMMSLDASRHLWNARVDPRRRTYAAGLYTHVRDRWGIVYDQPIVLNERQAGVAIEGVETNNRGDDLMRLSLVAVDTHGYTNPAMAIAKLLGFDLCPRLRDLAERKLHLPRVFRVPEGLEAVTVRSVSLSAIEHGWDELLCLAASIRSGRVSATLALQRFGSAAQGDPLHRAAEHLGRLLRTVFLCDYIAIEDFRREIHTLLNRGDSREGRRAHGRGESTRSWGSWRGCPCGCSHHGARVARRASCVQRSTRFGCWIANRPAGQRRASPQRLARRVPSIRAGA
ncbi:Tn3 family transposase [Variovorax sp. J22R115]|nr:Tn3 family transposase [Variovorax sp. J22R115]MDM0050627.1 Tn3 family transposase [Variovorax sp. J22R115]